MDLDAFLDMLRCPESGKELERLDAESLEELNERILGGEVRDLSGDPVQTPLDDALRPKDAVFVYPVRNGVPDLLLDDRILLSARSERGS